MIALAYVVLAIMLGAYVLLDGYDLGVAIIHRFVARGDEERDAAVESIGPFWSGNEVWLIAAGGTLFALFPQVYASSFSGFYLPFMVVLWLLMFRGIAFELRGHFPSDLWRGFFDVTFAVASGLLVLLFGVALGNIVRGVPLNTAHYFVGSFAFLLNPYALAVGVLAVLALTQHGAAWIALRVDGPPSERAVGAIRILLPIVFALGIVATIATFFVHSPLPNLRAMPWIAIAPLATLGGLAWMALSVIRARKQRIFHASMLFLAGMLASAAAAIYPYLLPGFPSAQSGLSAYTNPPSPIALATTLTVVIVGLIIVAAYRALVVKKLVAKAP